MNENNAELREDNGTLSRKRRTALVTYLAILFAVAFLLVALDMIIENHKLQSSNQALEDSNKISMASSASALEKAEKPQDENRSLQEKITGLETREQELTLQAEEAQALLEEMTKDKEAWQTEKDQLTKDNAALTQKQTDTVRANELLLQAMAASQGGLEEELVSAMRELEQLQDLLSETGKTTYQDLLKDLPEE